MISREPQSVEEAIEWMRREEEVEPEPAPEHTEVACTDELCWCGAIGAILDAGGEKS